MDYKEIIEKYWSSDKIDNSEQFQNVFTIETGLENSNKSEKIKWISQYNKYRNKIAHYGTNEIGINVKEVEYLYKVYTFFKLDEK